MHDPTSHAPDPSQHGAETQRLQPNPCRWPWTMVAALTGAVVLAAAALAVALIVAAGGTETQSAVERRLTGLEQEVARPAEPQALADSPAQAEDAIAGLAAELETLRQNLATLEANVQSEMEALHTAQTPPPDQDQPDSSAVETLRRDLEALRATVAGFPREPAAPPIAGDLPAADGTDRQLANLEQASIAALGALDQQLQAISGDLASLRAQDAAISTDLEDTRIALEAELVRWRERQSPPVWRLSAQLAGLTVQFSEGSNLANPGEVQSKLRNITGWLLEAEPEIGLRVVGYADLDGDGGTSNRITSQKRADEVREMLIVLGVPADRVVAVGRSAEKRLVDDDSGDNANRRAEFEAFLLPKSTP